MMRAYFFYVGKQEVSSTARVLHPPFRLLDKHRKYLGLTVNHEHNLHAKLPSHVSYPAVTGIWDNFVD